MQYAMLCHLAVYASFVFCPKTVLCKIYVLLRHLTCQCRPASCKTKYYLNTLYVWRKIYMCCFDISHVIAAVLECIAGLLLAEWCRQMPIAFTVSAFSLRILHCLDTSMTCDSARMPIVTVGVTKKSWFPCNAWAYIQYRKKSA